MLPHTHSTPPARRTEPAVTFLTDIATRLLHPAVQALLLGLLCLGLVLGRRPRTALAAAVVAVAWAWIAATPAFALALRGRLATPPQTAHPRADAIVVLGGGVLPVRDWARTRTRAGRGLALWREGRASWVLVSGSDQAKPLAEGYAISGIPANRLLIDGASDNTHENARDSASLLAAHDVRSILLVTSSIHMRRAAASFRRQGLDVWPEPVPEAYGAMAGAPAWLPRRDALTLSARCLREYVALWVYHQRDWI